MHFSTDSYESVEAVAFLARIDSFRTSYLVIERFAGGRLSCRFFIAPRTIVFSFKYRMIASTLSA
jgi:hypothetical protein